MIAVLRRGRARVRGLGGVRVARPGWRFWVMGLAGLAAYAVFLVLHWPVAHAWEQIQRHGALPPGIEVGGLEGTVWRGRAVALDVQGFAVERLSWQVAGWPLLLGRLEVTGEASLEDGFMEGAAVVSRHGVGVDTFSGRVPARRLEPVAAGFSPRPPRLEGSIAFSVARLEMDRGGAVRALDGRVAWHDAVVTVDARAELGGMTSTLGVDGGGTVVGRLGDTGGPLVLDGEWRLTPDGRYVLDARADTRPEAEAVLAQTLALFGHRISVEGRLR